MTQPFAPRQRGFTLLELMVAVTLGIVVLLGLSTIFLRNSGSQTELERNLRQAESGRYAVETLSEDIMHAGFYSDFSPNSLVVAPAYQQPNPCATDLAQQGWDTTVSPPQLPVAIQGIAQDEVVNCLSDRLAGTEAVVIRRADTGPAIDFTGGSGSNLYLQISRCTKDVGRLVAAPMPSSKPETVFNLRMPDCAAVNGAVRRVLQRTYYIASCNDCAAKDGIPTLKRVEMIDGELRTLPVAEGIENLQLEFSLDTNDDGQPDASGTLGGKIVTGAAPAVWENVISARVHLLARATDKTAGFTETRNFQLGPDVEVKAPSDTYKRSVLTSTVRLINVGGRRE